MSIKNTSLEHTLSVIRRQVSDEFPELSLHFTINECPNLPQHPARDAIMAYMKDRPANKIGAIRMGLATEGKIPFFKKKEHFLATCDVNEETLNQENEHIFPDDPEKYYRLVGYRLAWNAIDLYKKYKAGKNDFYTLHDDIIVRTPYAIDRLRVNLNNECFAAMLMEQQGETGIIQQLMKKRATLCLNKIMYSKPEHNPYPIAYDATRIVYKELHDTNTDKTQRIKHTLFMTEEIDGTCDDITLKQWHEFCYAAQEMAWMDRSRNETLSAATYSSDNAHMRTTGYILAEALNTDISPLNNPQFYNPFADQEKYERMHHKAAKALFEPLMEKAIRDNRPELLVEEALRQNRRLTEGTIIGWCAPALVKTCKAFSKEDIRKELLYDLFHNVLKDTKWQDICMLNRFVTLKKRQGITITSDIVLKEYTRDKERLQNIAEAFSAI
jgi:hypothetical protein